MSMSVWLAEADDFENMGVLSILARPTDDNKKCKRKKRPAMGYQTGIESETTDYPRSHGDGRWMDGWMQMIQSVS